MIAKHAMVILTNGLSPIRQCLSRAGSILKHILGSNINFQKITLRNVWFESIGSSNLSLVYNYYTYVQMKPNEASTTVSAGNRGEFQYSLSYHHDVKAMRVEDGFAQTCASKYIERKSSSLLDFPEPPSGISLHFSDDSLGKEGEDEHQICSKSCAKLWQETVYAHHDSYAHPRLRC